MVIGIRMGMHDSFMELLPKLVWGVTKGKPNHFPVLLDVPLKVFWLEGKMSINADSEEEADFLGEVIVSLGQIPIPDIISADRT
jgi:hypothetical protein